MTLQDSRDRSFYSGDSSRLPAATDSDLTSRVAYDGRRASTTNTSNRYLGDVSIDNVTGTPRSGPADNSRPCEWISTKFNANKNGVYEVTIHDGNIYIKNEDGQERVTTPQQHHPAARDEYSRRDSNYYRSQSQNDYQDDSYRPRPEAYYPPQQPQWGYPPREPYGYPPRPYGYEQSGISAPGLIIGAALGALFGGHRHGYHPGGYYGGFQGGYQPYQNFQPVQSYASNEYYAPQQSYYRPQPRYYGTPRIVQYGVNPQYTSGYYPGTYYNTDGYDS